MKTSKRSEPLGRTTFMDPKEDGKTHINIYSKGNTLLGRLLSNFAHTPFVLPEDGEFASVEGYWYWLSCKDDSLRKLHGYAAKQAGRKLKASDWPNDPGFKQKICLAIEAKIKQSPYIKPLMKKNKLPYVHYYVYGDKVVEPQEGKWIIEFIQSMIP